MKNAKRIIALLLAALMALALAGCGASKNDTAASAGAYYDAREDYLYDEPAEAEAPMPAAAAEASNGVGGANNSVPDNAPDMSEKIIYNAEVTL